MPQVPARHLIISAMSFAQAKQQKPYSLRHAKSCEPLYSLMTKNVAAMLARAHPTIILCFSLVPSNSCPNPD
jgi:hypothetical protein